MTTADAHEALLEEILDAEALDADGRTLGKVTQILLDDLSGQPTWVCVSTGTLLTKQVLVPLCGATLAHGDLTLPWTRQQVTGAPQIALQERLTPEQERELMDHYGIAPAPDGQL